MSANMYRVGDYVFFEISSNAPYQIRRIEELNKTQSGNVEAKVMCFYRRRDISPALLKIADSHQGDKKKPVREKSSKESSAEPQPATNGDASPEEQEEAAKKDSASVKSEEEPMDQAPAASEEPKEPVSETKTEPKEETPQTEEEAKPSAEEDDEGKLEIKEEEEASGAMDTTEKTPSVNGSEEKAPEESESASEKKPDEDAGSEKPKEKSVEPMEEQGPTVGLPGIEKLNSTERHSLRHRELFLSRQIETLPATHIRGKCTVTLLNEMETPDSYLGKDDSFFYSLVYDPTQKTLLADKGEIRIGEKFQAKCPEIVSDEARATDREGETLETLIFHPHHSLTDRDIDQFLIVARAVGTFSRALDTSSSVKLPSLHMTAAAASRDVTLFHAMALLHHANYDLGQAMKYLVPPPSKQHYPLEADKTTGHHTVSLGGPILCRDQMEEWSAAEANLFEEALERYGKDFNDIRQDFLPWKSLKDIVEYYYMWKTTDRYVQQKRVKAMEADSRLKQVYIPNYNKPNQNLITNNQSQAVKNPKGGDCESCRGDASTQWYLWGPQSLLQLCGECWSYWKKYGGLKRSHSLENYDKNSLVKPETIPVTTSRPGLTVPGHHMPSSANSIAPNSRFNSNGGVPNQIRGLANANNLQQQFSPSQRGVPGHVIYGPKTKAAFFLRTTPLTRIARRVAPKNLLNARKGARNPFLPINMLAIKQYCQTRPQRELQQAMATMKASARPAATAPSAQHANNAGSASQPSGQAVRSQQQVPQQQQQQQQRKPHHTSSSSHHQASPASMPSHGGSAHHHSSGGGQKRPAQNGSASDGMHQAMKRAREMTSSSSNERAGAPAISNEALLNLYSGANLGNFANIDPAILSQLGLNWQSLLQNK